VPAAGASGGATVASLRFTHGLYDALTVAGGRLILSGGPDGSPLPAARHDAPGLTGCRAATVDPATMTVTGRRTGNCDDPRLFDQATLVVNDFTNGNPDGSHVQIAHVTGGGFAVGPVVMTYSELSDTDAEWLYGDGYLWLFDCLTTAGSELLRISATTGAVLQTVRMPQIDRPLLAVDDDGLWLAPAVNSSSGSIYRLAPGMARPVLVRHIHSDAYWMAAAGHSLWVSVNDHPKPPTLLRFDGTSTKPSLDIAFRGGFYGQFGYGQPHFAADAAGDIWTVASGHLYRIDGETGRVATVATVPTHFPSPIAVLGRHAFFYNAPVENALYRVTLP